MKKIKNADSWALRGIFGIIVSVKGTGLRRVRRNYNGEYGSLYSDFKGRFFKGSIRDALRSAIIICGKTWATP
jgi:hypothetical protein